jgi:hypothetical protein
VTDEEKAGGPVIWSNPNQQVVREDQSGPGIEDPGHSGEGGPGEAAAEGGSDDFESWTKVDLLALAKERGVSPANNDMTKQELIDGIRAAEG